MRILFLTNFYPPSKTGGYTQWCFEVAESLKLRGHTIGVLTSHHAAEEVEAGEQNIFRLLHLDGNIYYYDPLHFFTNWKREQEENLVILKRTVQEFNPNIIFIWGMWAMSRRVPAYAECLLPGRVIYYLSDYWLTMQNMHRSYWNAVPNRQLMLLPKKLLSRVASLWLRRDIQPEIRSDRTLCVSFAVRDILVEKGLPLENALVVHGGTDATRFPIMRKRDFLTKPLLLLYAGQLVQHKGVHTAIEAMDLVVNEFGICDVHLKIVGSGHPEYEATLKESINIKNLMDFVTLNGPVSRKEMPTILQQADILIFPSIYEEPFARMTQEAMLAGLVVVGTTTGGTKELLVDGENGLTFAPEDASNLAKQIVRLVGNPDLCRRLSANGRDTILQNYTLEIMVSKIEQFLKEVDAHSDN